MLTGEMSDTNLLLALFFSICSFWCTCQSSSSFLALSLHSASEALDAESCLGAKSREQHSQGEPNRGKINEQTENSKSHHYSYKGGSALYSMSNTPVKTSLLT